MMQKFEQVIQKWRNVKKIEAGEMWYWEDVEDHLERQNKIYYSYDLY